MNLPLLVVGAGGLIGRRLTAELLARGEAVVPTVQLASEFDGPAILLDLAHLPWPALPRCRAAVICAAVTQQEECRLHPETTRHINVVRTLELIQALIQNGTFVVFLSTNLVFDGSRPKRRGEEALCPRTEYGRQKAEVEHALGQWPDRVAIVRLTKVFHRGLPLLQSWVQDLTAGRPVRAFCDYVCAPLILGQVVSELARIAAEQRSGVWQFSGPHDLSYADLAWEVARQMGVDQALVQPVPAPPGMLEHQPQYTTLDTARAETELGMVFPEAPAVLAGCLGHPARAET